MLATIGASAITIVLAVAALVVYMKAVRYDKPWGAPLMTLLVLGAVAAVVIPRTPQYQRAQHRRRRPPRYLPVQMIGEKLGPQLSDGARVVVLRHPLESEMMQIDYDQIPEEYEMPTPEEELARQKEQLKEAFERDSGIEINIVASVTPADDDYYMMYEPGGDVDAINDALAPFEGEGIDLIVSLIGLPGIPYEGIYELEYLACFDWDDPPMFAADVGLDYDPDIMRAYIEDGLLSAAVIFPERGVRDRVVIGSDNLDELPETSPRHN